MNEMQEKRNIALIGFSATGKTAVAAKVANRLKWNLIDIDRAIEHKTGKSIPDIFQSEGEQKFREMEHTELRNACLQSKTVIATGGGAVLTEKNRKLLKGNCVVICLEADVETIYKRLLRDTVYSSNPVVRPLLAVEEPKAKISELKATRQRHYAIADWTVHTDMLTPDDATQEVLRGFKYIIRNSEQNILQDEDDLACIVNAASRVYPVYAGWEIMGSLGHRMRENGITGSATIISDNHVFNIYGKQCRDSLEKAGYTVYQHILRAGETSKTIANALRIIDEMLANKIDRHGVVVALGGGMVGDLAGFVASAYLRGIPLVQVPTSLLAMVDASIGGKVAVNHVKGKNLIGSFYQPWMVMADTNTLVTLPERELISGWAEVIKYGLILDAAFFHYLEANSEKLKKLDSEMVTAAIARSVSIKAYIVEEDEKETGRRIILNYGHTLAHGLEAATGYRTFLHGEAVSIGMIAAAAISHRMRILPQNAVRRQQELLDVYGLPIKCTGVKLAPVLDAMQVDKKVRDKTIRWVLLEDIGKAIVRDDVPVQEIEPILRKVGIT